MYIKGVGCEARSLDGNDACATINLYDDFMELGFKERMFEITRLVYLIEMFPHQEEDGE